MRAVTLRLDEVSEAALLEALAQLDTVYAWWQKAREATPVEIEYATLKRAVLQGLQAQVEGWQIAGRAGPDWSQDA